MRLAWQHKINQINRCLLHDLSNHLTGVLALSELYYEHTSVNALHEALGIIRQNALKGRDLLSLLSTLSYPKITTYTFIDLKSLLQTLAPIIKAILPSHTHFEVNFKTPDACLLQANPYILQQIFLQLLFNAGEAVTRVKKPHICLSVEKSENNIMCCLCDNGKGFPSHLMEQLFKPYVTTYRDDQHLGLGLFSVKEHLRSMEGSITINNSTPRGGACVTFYLTLKNI